MVARGAFFLLLVLVVGCAPHHDAPATRDTLLTTPATPDTHRHPTEFGSGLLVDSSRVLPLDRQQVLARFSPKQILAIYEAYRPLRRTGISQSSVDSFLHAEKITSTELHSILEQGDRLGWSAPPSTAK